MCGQEHRKKIYALHYYSAIFTIRIIPGMKENKGLKRKLKIMPNKVITHSQIVNYMQRDCLGLGC